MNKQIEEEIDRLIERYFNMQVSALHIILKQNSDRVGMFTIDKLIERYFNRQVEEQKDRGIDRQVDGQMNRNIDGVMQLQRIQRDSRQINEQINS